MKKIIPLYLSLFLASCKINQPIQQIKYGSYKTNYINFTDELIINSDKTFHISFKLFEGTSECSGTWYFKNSKTIILDCYEPENIYETLEGNYLSKRTMTMEIINNGELMFDNITFKNSE